MRSKFALVRASAGPIKGACTGPFLRKLLTFIATFGSILGSISAQSKTAAGTSAAVVQAQRLLARNEPRQALEVLHRNENSIDPLSLHLLLGTANALLDDTGEAHVEFARAVELAPRKASVRKQYGLSLLRLGEISGARTELREAEAIDPQDAETHFNLALLSVRDKQPDAALPEVRQAIALSHDNARTCLYRTTAGQMELMMQDWHAAKTDFDEALAIDPAKAAAWSGLGYALQQAGDLVGGRNALRKATTLDAQDVDAWQHLGEVSTGLEDCDSAANAYGEVSRINPQDRSALNHLVRSLRACGRKDKAIAATARLQALVQRELELGHLGPEMTLKNAEAIAAEQGGDFTSAERTYRELVTLDPEDPVFRRNLGLLLCRQAKWDEGLMELKRALALDPDDAESQRALHTALALGHSRQ